MANELSLSAPMIRHVLLMLSSAEPPPPEDEIRWHAAACQRDGSTALVTTRVLTKLTPGHSTVAFYGNADLNNDYLGCGTFLEYVPLDTHRGQEILAEHPLYLSRGIPRGARAFIILRDVCEARAGEDLESLNGAIDSSGWSDGLPLTLEHIPQGAARIQVYFSGTGCPCGAQRGAI